MDRIDLSGLDPALAAVLDPLVQVLAIPAIAFAQVFLLFVQFATAGPANGEFGKGLGELIGAIVALAIAVVLTAIALIAAAIVGFLLLSWVITIVVVVWRGDSHSEC